MVTTRLFRFCLNSNTVGGTRTNLLEKEHVGQETRLSSRSSVHSISTSKSRTNSFKIQQRYQHTQSHSVLFEYLYLFSTPRCSLHSFTTIFTEREEDNSFIHSQFFNEILWIQTNKKADFISNQKQIFLLMYSM